MNMPFTVKGFSVALGCLFALSCSALGATSTKYADTLNRISRQMYAEQNEHFILVEAVKDGLIEPGESFLFEYASSGISINGRKLPAADNSRYLKLMQEFYTNGVTVKGPDSWRMEGDSLSLEKDLLNPTSSFRTRGPWVHTARKPTKLLIIEELARDGIADTAACVRLIYTQKALTVNGLLLPAALQEKYRTLIRVMDGFSPTKETDIYSINH